MSKGKRLRAQRSAAPPPVGKKQPTDPRLWVVVGVVVAIVVAGIAFTAVRSGGAAAPKAVSESRLVGLEGGQGPWPPEIAHLADRLQALGLPLLGQEGLVVHVHEHLDVFVNGRRLVVPGGIGINDGSFISPLHTHDPTGVIHVESPTKEHFSLAELFAIWGVRFGSHRVGGYHAPTPIRFYVDGRQVKSDPRQLELAAHQEIAIAIGTLPKHIPSRYSFAVGE